MKSENVIIPVQLALPADPINSQQEKSVFPNPKI